MKCDAIVSLDEISDGDRCEKRATQFTLLNGTLYCRCEEHPLRTQFKDVKRLTEDEAAVVATMWE